MGRNKLKIQKLESSSQRQVTYSKRKTGITKKVRELSILCDVDALLILFSTTGKPTLCLGENSKFEEVIKRYSQISPEERIKKKYESLEALRKTFKNTDHVIDIDQLMHQGSEKPNEDMTKQLKMYKEQIEDTLSFLGPLGELENLDNIESIDKVIAMEKALNQIINGTKIHKENYENMLMNHFKCPAQVTNKGLTLNGEPGPSSLLDAPSPLRLPEFILSPHIDSAFGKNNSYFSNFDVTTGGVQLNGTGGLSSAWFCMGQNPQSLLLENPFSLHHGDLTSISNQGCTSSDETEAIMSNKKQTPPLQYMRNGASSSQQTMIEHNHLPKTSTLGEGLLNANIFADNWLIHNPFVFDQSYFGCDFKTPDFDAWASADQPDIKASIHNLQQNQLKNRDVI